MPEAPSFPLPSRPELAIGFRRALRQALAILALSAILALISLSMRK